MKLGSTFDWFVWHYERDHYSEGGFVLSWVMTNDLICYTMETICITQQKHISGVWLKLIKMAMSYDLSDRRGDALK